MWPLHGCCVLSSSVEVHPSCTPLHDASFHDRYWTSSEEAGFVRSCLPQRCVGGAELRCEVGYAGPFCSSVSSGHVCAHILLTKRTCRTLMSLNVSVPLMCLDTSLLGRQCDENFYLELKQCVACGDCELCARMLFIATAVFVLLFTLSILFMSTDMLNHFFSVICYLQVPISVPLRCRFNHGFSVRMRVRACVSRFVVLG